MTRKELAAMTDPELLACAALAALDDRQLAAVVAHERAHLTGHHSLIVTGLRGLAAVFPRLNLFTEGLQHVSRLLEMCADDAAVRRHDRRALLSGLVTLCRAAPAEALAAADLAVLARAERLAAAPGDPAAAQARAALASVVALLAASVNHRRAGRVRCAHVRGVTHADGSEPHEKR